MSDEINDLRDNSLDDLEQLQSLYKEESIKKKKGVSKPLLVSIFLLLFAVLGTLYFISFNKVSLEKSIDKTNKAYTEEFKRILDNNKVYTMGKEIVDNNHEINFKYISDDILYFNGILKNDKSNKISYIGADIEDFGNVGIYITDEENYLSVLNNSYQFDVEDGFYKLFEWIIESYDESYLYFNNLLLSNLKGIDFKYSLLDELKEEQKELYKTLEKNSKNVRKNNIDNIDIEKLQGTLFVDGEDKDVIIYSTPVDINNYMLEQNRLSKDIFSQYNIDFLEDYYQNNIDMYEGLKFEDSFLKSYVYNDYILRYEIETKFLDEESGMKIPVILYITHNSTTNMLDYIEMGMDILGMKIQIVMENDLFSTEHLIMNISLLTQNVKNYEFGFNWDYNKTEDNLKIYFSDYEMGYKEEEYFSINYSDSNGVTISYNDYYTEEEVKLELKLLNSNINIPTNSEYLYNNSFEEFLIKIYEELMGFQINMF